MAEPAESRDALFAAHISSPNYDPVASGVIVVPIRGELAKAQVLVPLAKPRAGVDTILSCVEPAANRDEAKRLAVRALANTWRGAEFDVVIVSRWRGAHVVIAYSPDAPESAEP
eukprot:5004099-Prymnesium_polylepis.1